MTENKKYLNLFEKDGDMNRGNIAIIEIRANKAKTMAKIEEAISDHFCGEIKIAPFDFGLALQGGWHELEVSSDEFSGTIIVNETWVY